VLPKEALDHTDALETSPRKTLASLAQKIDMFASSPLLIQILHSNPETIAMVHKH
jgi:hypothetical protein